MLAFLLAAALSAAPACKTVPQQCRACTTVAGKQVCSTPGFACQPERVVRSPMIKGVGKERVSTNAAVSGTTLRSVADPYCGREDRRKR